VLVSLEYGEQVVLFLWLRVEHLETLIFEEREEGIVACEVESAGAVEDGQFLVDGELAMVVVDVGVETIPDIGVRYLVHGTEREECAEGFRVGEEVGFLVINTGGVHPLLP
jgi:hypothetical protein